MPFLATIATNAATRHDKPSFHWDDPLLLDTQWSDEERMVRAATAGYCGERLEPRIRDGFRHE